MIHISKILTSLSPQASWSLSGDTYESLTWLSEDIEQPSKEVVEAEQQRQQALLDAVEYQRLRAAEYPPMADYLDAIVKNDQEQLQAYIDACLAVKAKYPKPGV